MVRIVAMVQVAHRVRIDMTSRSCQRAVCASLLLVGALALSAPAQKTDNSANPWSVSAQALTDSMLVDANSLAGLDQALLFARLGEAWWKDDPKRARIWLNKSVEELDYSSSSDSVDKRNRRLFIARALLGIITPRDRALSVRLANIFASESEKLPDDERAQNAEALIDAALAVVDDDPERAAQLGLDSLRSGRTRQLGDLLEKLSARDARLGAALFGEALALARASSDSNLFLQLTQVSFPNGQDSLSNPIPLAVRTQLLSSLAQVFMSSSGEPGKNVTCKFAWISASMLGQYYRLFPQQAPLVREALGQCQATLDEVARGRVDEALNDKALKSVDDFLQAAERAKDPKVQTFHRMRAAFMAAQQRDYDRAIVILDSISSDSREPIKRAWEGGRWDYAARSAFSHAKSGDYETMRRVIADTPADLRPLTLIDVAERLSGGGDQSIATELAHEARGTLAKARLSESQRVETQISLVRLFAKLLPAEAPLALQEMAEAMNRATQMEPAKEEGLDGNPRGALLLAPISLPPSLLEMDGLGVQQTATSIKPPVSRIRVRLGLLASSLEKMRSAPPEKKKADAGRESNPSVNR
jgi:hypothetical protein